MQCIVLFTQLSIARYSNCQGVHEQWVLEGACTYLCGRVPCLEGRGGRVQEEGRNIIVHITDTRIKIT